MNRLLCRIGIHKFSGYKYVWNPHRVEGTCERCGKKNVYL